MKKIKEEVFTRVMTTVGFLQSVCHIVSLSKPLLTCKSGFMLDISSSTLLGADWHNDFIRYFNPALSDRPVSWAGEPQFSLW